VAKSGEKEGHHKRNNEPLNEDQNYVNQLIWPTMAATNHHSQQHWNEIQSQPEVYDSGSVPKKILVQRRRVTQNQPIDQNCAKSDD